MARKQKKFAADVDDRRDPQDEESRARRRELEAAIRPATSELVTLTGERLIMPCTGGGGFIGFNIEKALLAHGMGPRSR